MIKAILLFFLILFSSNACVAMEETSQPVVARPVKFDSEEYILLERGGGTGSGRPADEIAEELEEAEHEDYFYAPQAELRRGKESLGYANVVPQGGGLCEIALSLIPGKAALKDVLTAMTVFAGNHLFGDTFVWPTKNDDGSIGLEASMRCDGVYIDVDCYDGSWNSAVHYTSVSSGETFPPGWQLATVETDVLLRDSETRETSTDRRTMIRAVLMDGGIALPAGYTLLKGGK